MALIRCFKRLVLWHTNWSCLHLHEYTLVFHVSCLKKVIGDKIPVQTIFPWLDEEGKIILEPEAITDTRILQLRNRSISEYLIKWRKLSAGDSTWEDEYFIQKHPTLLKRCGKNLSQGEGILSPK
jgi:hypothetical protein